jgi:histidyl-tRNA synthetase
LSINAPKGTKDILPAESRKWQYIENAFSEICDEYGFAELRTPTFESTELFNRGVGDTTDIVQKEMYTFQDLGGRSITLKPEGTSPAVRAFIESRQYAEVQPSKYWYNTSCFRYEKPQAGRLREFHQFGIENFGSKEMLADAEIIALADDFLSRMGVTDVELRINSVGCKTCRAAYKDALRAFLKPHYDELCETCKSRYETNPMRILDCKSPKDQEIVKDAPLMIDYLCDDCRNSFEELKSHLETMGIDYKVDPKIVRGLDYYTKTAFEFVTERIGSQGTVCGGGRYDHLIEEVGGPDMAGVGFGLGKERLILLMEECGADFGETKDPQVFIAFIGEKAERYTLKLMQKLRKEGIRTAIDTAARKMKGQLNYANKLNARYSVVIGDDEIESGELTLKDMRDSSQTKVTVDELIEQIRRDS